AADKGPQTPIREVMSKDVMYCFDDDELDDIVQNMADIKVRRLPVLDRDKRLVGILSLGDIALTEGAGSAGSALCGISEPGGEHRGAVEGGRGMGGPGGGGAIAGTADVAPRSKNWAAPNWADEAPPR